MTAFRTNGGEVTESVRIRDLLEQAQAVAG
jgi:hypothetical protein